MRQHEHMAIDVQKGLIIEIVKDNGKELYIKIRKAEADEKQQEIPGHYGYKVGEYTTYCFDLKT